MTMLDSPAGAVWESFGSAVGFVGDINNDGYDDIGVGAPNAAPLGLTDQGLAYIYLGSDSGIETTPTVVSAHSPSLQQYFGWSIAHGGDVNDDGVDDAAIGSGGFELAGQVEFLYGSLSGAGSVTNEILLPSDPDGKHEFSRQIVLLGDTDGDLAPELAISAPYRTNGQGAAYVYSPCLDVDLDGSCATEDCDDLEPTTYPGAPESCDNVDSDCDSSLVDEFPDFDGDGIPDCTDDDDDGDSVLDVDDTDPLDPSICEDLDGDSCDDCSVTGGPPDTANDGVDTDGDGICDATDVSFDRLQGGGCLASFGEGQSSLCALLCFFFLGLGGLMHRSRNNSDSMESKKRALTASLMLLLSLLFVGPASAADPPRLDVEL